LTKFSSSEPLAVLIGTIIGAGIFSLPYVAFKTGFGITVFYVLVLSILTIVVHQLLAEVSRGTQKIHRLPGYTEEYLGKNWRNFSLIISSLELIGTLLAYLILGGGFLQSYFTSYFGGSTIFYVLIYFVVGSFLIYLGIKSIAKTEIVMFAFFILILFLFFFYGAPALNFQNLLTFQPQNFFWPYGPILFSLWGLTLVPEIKEMVAGNRQKLRRVISAGIIFCALYYLLFIFIILGVSGNQTSADALSGFGKIVGSQVIRLGFIFGFFATFTSFITLGLTFKKILQYDLKLPEKFSWVITCFSPLILYLLGIKNFLNVISLTGAVLLGLEAIIVILIYKNFLKKKFQQKAPFWLYPLAGFFLLGLILQIISPWLFQ